MTSQLWPPPFAMAYRSVCSEPVTDSFVACVDHCRELPSTNAAPPLMPGQAPLPAVELTTPPLLAGYSSSPTCFGVKMGKYLPRGVVSPVSIPHVPSGLGLVIRRCYRRRRGWRAPCASKWDMRWHPFTALSPIRLHTQRQVLVATRRTPSALSSSPRPKIHGSDSVDRVLGWCSSMHHQLLDNTPQRMLADHPFGRIAIETVNSA
jgi:hypothetical protein